MIEISLNAKFIEAIEKIIKTPELLTVPVSEKYKLFVEETFESEGWEKWPALKKSTIRDREKKGYT